MCQSNLKPALDAFKVFQLFWSQKTTNLNPDLVVINSLRAFPFLEVEVLLISLKLEVPHLATAAGLTVGIDPLLKNMFGDHQDSSLHDYKYRNLINTSIQ